MDDYIAFAINRKLYSQEVIGICHALPPWRTSKLYFGAKSVLELPAGTAEASQTKAGDRLSFETMS